MLVKQNCPQYRLLLNRRPEVYEKIPAGLAEDKLDVETLQDATAVGIGYSQEETWHWSEGEARCNYWSRVPEVVRRNIAENITDLSRASLAEYVAHRKAVLDLFEQALEVDASGKYSKESRIHSIICPMQTTSDEVKFDDMNLWLIDERLAYHQFLASDKKINSISILDSNVDKRMDLAIFDAALSYTADPNDINSLQLSN